MVASVKKMADQNIEFFPEVEQQTDPWYALRLGIPTSSCFAMVGRDTESKTRTEYMRKLAGEIITGKPAEGKIETAAMRRGNFMEPMAREHYERAHLVAVERIGFVRRQLPSGRFVGCSPDGLTNKRRRGLEIKTVAPHRLIPLLEPSAAIPSEHLAQIWGTMWIADLEEVDLLLFYQGMPDRQFTIKRNEQAIKEISDAAQVFDHDLHKLVKKIKTMGSTR